VESVRVVESVSNPELHTRVTYSTRDGGYHLESVWRFGRDGTISLTHQFLPFGELPYLPRIGVDWVLDRELDQLTWLGHGPHENYPDRLESAFPGVWSGTVAEQYVPYSRPQATGNKEGVRWMALRNRQGAGVLFGSHDNPFSATALHVTTTDLDVAKHTHELKPRPEVFLTLDAAHMGLGNSSCGPGVLQQFAVPSGAYTLNLFIRPLNPGDLPHEVANRQIP
jgi:beta-galactosidase